MPKVRIQLGVLILDYYTYVGVSQPLSVDHFWFTIFDTITILEDYEIRNPYVPEDTSNPATPESSFCDAPVVSTHVFLIINPDQFVVLVVIIPLFLVDVSTFA